jgi:hypothetical protein
MTSRRMNTASSAALRDEFLEHRDAWLSLRNRLQGTTAASTRSNLCVVEECHRLIVLAGSLPEIARRTCPVRLRYRYDTRDRMWEPAQPFGHAVTGTHVTRPQERGGRFRSRLGSCGFSN